MTILTMTGMPTRSADGGSTVAYTIRAYTVKKSAPRPSCISVDVSVGADAEWLHLLARCVLGLAYLSSLDLGTEGLMVVVCPIAGLR